MTVRLVAPQLTVVPAGISLHAVTEYLEQQFPNTEIGLHPLSTDYALGINSHVFRVSVQESMQNGEKVHHWLLKCVDPRNPRALKKLYTETAFYHYCQQLASKLPIARFYDANTERGFLLLSFIQGKTPPNATNNDVAQCFAFIESLNSGNDYERQKLPKAADAQGGLGDVVNDVERRLARKNQLLPRADAVQAQAIRDCYHFLLIDFIPSWQKWTAEHSELIAKHNVPLDAVSPSDFGLHNSLHCGDASLLADSAMAEPRLVFFDFEYAGRDSYWKLLADMLAQPKIPLPVAAVIAQTANSSAFEFVFEQSETFLVFVQATLYKWVLIQLNMFFKSPPPDPDKLAPQLEQAHRYWLKIDSKIDDIRHAIEQQQLKARQRGVVITGVSFS